MSENPEVVISINALGFSFYFDEFLNGSQIDYIQEEIDSVKKYYRIGEYYEDIFCEYCGKMAVNVYYLTIIGQLKKANLLSDDYKIICCDCFTKLNEKNTSEKISDAILTVMEKVLEFNQNENTHM